MNKLKRTGIALATTAALALSSCEKQSNIETFVKEHGKCGQVTDGKKVFVWDKNDSTFTFNALTPIIINSRLAGYQVIDYAPFGSVDEVNYATMWTIGKNAYNVKKKGKVPPEDDMYTFMTDYFDYVLKAVPKED